YTRRDIRAVAADQNALFRALERLYPEKELREAGLPSGPSDAELAELEKHGIEKEDEDLDPIDLVEAGAAGALLPGGVPDEPPGERTLNLLLLQAAEDRTEQLILEPLDDCYRVRFRRAGRL